MKTLSVTAVILLLGSLSCAVPTEAGDAKPLRSVGEICTEFESRIKSQVSDRQYLDAVCTAAEYEQELLSRYPKATFELGLFQNTAHHISFQSPFEGWTQESLKEMDIPDWLPSMGFDILIALKGRSENDEFVLFSLDMGRIMQRVTGEEMREVSDQELQLGAQLMAANLGVIKNQQFKAVGDHRVLLVNIAPPALGPSVILANMAHKGRLYGFLMTSSAGSYSENEKRLSDLLKSVDFKFSPANTTKIGELRRKFSNRGDIAQLLHCVRELAIAGEYGAASEDLTALRSVIAERMPKPTSNGNVARYSAYGITFRNPDPSRWKISTQSQGGLGMLLLEDQYSVNSRGVAVGVINTVLAYGPQAADLTGENTSDEEKRGFLSSGGRGGLMNIGASIESERFRIFKGTLAYEGVGSMNVPNTKVKCLWTLKQGYAIMVLMIVEASNYAEQSAELEALIDKYLEVEDQHRVSQR
jgi:hypothetical protein